MNALVKQQSGAVTSRNYEQELLSFLCKLVIRKNDISEEMYQYHLDTTKKIYDDALQYSIKRAGRIPTLEELMNRMLEFNYTILWELAQHDYKKGLGQFGYSSSIEGYGYESENELITEVYECWDNRLCMELRWQPQEYISELLCELDLCYYDDVNFEYKIYSASETNICINDCQNLLLPDWHFKSISRRNSHENEDYIMRMIFLDEEIKEIFDTENQDEKELTT
jgi:hypothetical protein